MIAILGLLRIPAVTVLAGLLIIACGGGGGGSDSADEAVVKQTLSQFLAAIAAGDGVTACALATPEGQAVIQQLGGGNVTDCTQAVAFGSAGLAQATKDGLATAQVDKVTIDGDTATIEDKDVTSTTGDLSGFLDPNSPPIVLTKQPDGTWKLSG